MSETKEYLTNAEYYLTEALFSLRGGSTDGLERDSADADSVAEMLSALRALMKERYTGK